jgi:hypothetical protein
MKAGRSNVEGATPKRCRVLLEADGGSETKSRVLSPVLTGRPIRGSPLVEPVAQSRKTSFSRGQL